MKRRRNGEGTITKLASGRWLAQANFGRDENGKLIRKSFYGDTSEEAIEKRKQALNKSFGVPVTEFINPSKERLLDLFKKFLLTYYKGTVTSRTFKNKMELFNNHIEPYFKNALFKDIRKETLQKFFNYLRDEKKLHVNYIRKFRNAFCLFYDYCIDEIKIAKENIARQTSVYNIHKQPTRGYKPLSFETAVKFFKALYSGLEDEKTNKNAKEGSAIFLLTLCMAMYFSGPRIAETLAIQWKKFDFDRRVTKVDRAVFLEYVFDDDGKKIKTINSLGEPKTEKGNRETPIPVDLYDCLVDYYNFQKEREKKTGIDYTSPEQFVFCNREGKLRTYSGTKSIFKRFLKRHDLHELGICFHGMRKTTSQVLFEAKRTASEVQTILGHADPTTTLKHYSSAGANTMSFATKDLEQHGSRLFAKVKEQEAIVDEEEELLLQLLSKYSAEELVDKIKKKKDFEM